MGGGHGGGKVGLRQGSVIGEEPVGCAIVAHNSLLAVIVKLESLTCKALCYSPRLKLLQSSAFSPCLLPGLRRPLSRKPLSGHQCRSTGRSTRDTIKQFTRPSTTNSPSRALAGTWEGISTADRGG